MDERYQVSVPLHCLTTGVLYSVHPGKCEATSRHFRQFLTTFRAETDQHVLFPLLLTLSRGISTRFGSNNLETPQQTELSETGHAASSDRLPAEQKRLSRKTTNGVVLTAFLARRKHIFSVTRERAVTLHHWLYFSFPLLPSLLIFRSFKFQIKAQFVFGCT